MKHRRRVAAGVLSLLVTGLAWVLTLWQEGLIWAPAEETVAEPAYIDLSPGEAADIIALSWQYNGEELILSRDEDEGIWYNLTDRDCPVDSDVADRLTEALAGACATLEIQKPGDPAQYGLEEPYITVMAATRERMVTYEIGNMTLKGETYIRVDRGDTVFLETGVLSSAFALRLGDILDTETLSDPGDALTSLTVTTGSGSYSLSRCSVPPEGWYGTGDGWFYRSGDTLLPLDEAAAEAFCAAVAEMPLSSCVAWEEADMEALGLSAPQATAKLVTTDENGTETTLSLEFGNWEEGELFVRSGSSGYAYRTDSAVLDALLHPDLIALQSSFVCLMDWNLVTGAELTVPEGTVTVERVQEPDENDPSGEPADYYLANGWTLEPDRVTMWVSRLDDLTGQPVAADVPEEAPCLSLCFALGEDIVTLSLYPYDSGHYLCRMGDRVLLVEQTSPDSLINDAEDFIAST